MPLLKLWNCITGRSAAPESAEQGPATKTEPRSGSKSTPTLAPKSKSRNNAFGLFGGPHAGLCKMVKSIPAASVLEISVDDGSRALAVLKTLSKKQEKVTYYAIDQFEMDGGISLKQFHQTLRAANVTPRLFPDEVDRGLMRIAHTIGAVDLVLIAADAEVWQNDATIQSLSRVCHTGTEVLHLEGETWQRFDTTLLQVAGRRRAA